MPPLPTIPNGFRVTLNWNAGGMPANSVMNFLMPGGSPASLFALLNSSVSAGMWTTVGAGASVTSVDILPYDGTTPTQVFTATGAQWAGTGTGDFTIALAVLVSLRTAVRGPRGRGRLFLPFTAEGVTNAGAVNAALFPAIQTAWEGFDSAMSAGGATWCVGSLFSTLGAPALRDITTINVEVGLATQRRRQDRIR